MNLVGLTNGYSLPNKYDWLSAMDQNSKKNKNYTPKNVLYGDLGNKLIDDI